MLTQVKEVQKFFDDLAHEYGARYRGKNAYYRYFFNQRLEAATSLLNLENAYILDIGAGTGALYDYLQKHVEGFEYEACDISPSMLEHSSIPRAKRKVGQATEIDFQGKLFDCIFMLGVTSYMGKKDFEAHLLVIEKLLKGKGKAVVSFTHRCSLDNYFRNFLQIFYPKKFFKRNNGKVLGMPFPTNSYCLLELPPPTEHLAQTHHEWLNQTISPFNHLFPRISVFTARIIKKYLPLMWLPYWSADFIVVFEKHESQ